MTSAGNIKPRIAWITPDYFVDCDFNPEVLNGLLESFDIYWIVLLPASNARFSEKDFGNLKQVKGLHIEFFYWKSRARSPRMVLFYESVYSRIKQLKVDLVYFNEVPTSPYILPIYWRLNRKKTIVTAHDGSVKPSFKLAWISRIVFRLAFRSVRYVNMFSASQARIFSSNFPRAKVFLISLGLKDFGAGSVEKRTDTIVFFFFGSIHSSKNVGLLIEAGCLLHEQGVTGFTVAIYGQSSDWEAYQSKIKYPEIFECDIRLFPSAEVANVFARNHYMVFPYSQMSQSGALKVAFNYRVPVIVSNLEGFTDEVTDGLNGFVFESNNVKDLARVMQERLMNHARDYPLLVKRMAEYNQIHYSNESLIAKYSAMFNEVIRNNPGT